MRTKTIIDGFKNSQKFRYIITTECGSEVGMYLTVKQMSDQFATSEARLAVWQTLQKLAYDRQMAKIRGDDMPTGLVTSAYGFRQVQVDLH